MSKTTSQLKNNYWAIQALKIPVFGKIIARALLSKDEVIDNLLTEAKKQQSLSERKG